MEFEVLLEYGEDGWITVECPALPGCMSQGRTREEAMRNIREAAIAWMWAESVKGGSKWEIGI